jgi:Mg2+/Co2+ transporter CorB
MLVIICGLLVGLTFLSLAEMSLSRITKQKAQALVEQNAKSAKMILKLAAEPTRWVNPLLLTVNIFQTVQATLTGVVAGRLFGAAGVIVGVALNVNLVPLQIEA